MRHLSKLSNDLGFIVEVFSNQDEAGKSLEVLKSVQSINEQAMAKVTVIEVETR